MRFRQLDRIVDLQPGERILARKRVDADARYLRDHFPNFALLPGVLMLEGIYQAAMWLALKTDDFARPCVRLTSARAVKYSGLVQPGDELDLSAEVVKWQEDQVTFKGTGVVHRQEGEQTAVSARIGIELGRVVDLNPERSITDFVLRRELRMRFRDLVVAGEVAS